MKPETIGPNPHIHYVKPGSKPPTDKEVGPASEKISAILSKVDHDHIRLESTEAIRAYGIMNPNLTPHDPNIVTREPVDPKGLLDGRLGIMTTRPKFGEGLPFGMFRDAAHARRAAQGNSEYGSQVPVHAFLHQDYDFLNSAAADYARLQEGQRYNTRGIEDYWFISDTLDFFTGGNATQEDYRNMEASIDQLVNEMASNLRNGQDIDFNKLQTKLNIAGEEVSVEKLMEMQALGKDLSATYGNIGLTPDYEYVANAKAGIAKGIAEYYGSKNGEIGRRFSEGMASLYEQKAKNVHSNSQSVMKNNDRAEHTKAMYDIYSKSMDMFSAWDISSADSMRSDLNSKLTLYESMLKQYSNQYNDVFVKSESGNLRAYLEKYIA